MKISKKFLVLCLVLFMLLIPTSLALDYEGRTLKPESAAEVDFVGANTLSFFSYWIGKLFTEKALYSDKAGYEKGKVVHLQAEIATWKVKCNDMTTVYEMYGPENDIRVYEGTQNMVTSQTTSAFLQPYADVPTGGGWKIGTYNAVAYIKCKDAPSIFSNNNVEYNMGNYPLISTPEVSKTAFEIMEQEWCNVINNNATTKCYNDNIYWYNNCGGLYELKEACDSGCASDSKCNGGGDAATQDLGGDGVDDGGGDAATQDLGGDGVDNPQLGTSDIRIMSVKIKNIPSDYIYLVGNPGDKIDLEVKLKNVGDQDSSGELIVEAGIYASWYAVPQGLLSIYNPDIQSCGEILGQKFVDGGTIQLDAGEETVITLSPVFPGSGDTINGRENIADDGRYALMVGLARKCGEQYTNDAGLTGWENQVVFSRRISEQSVALKGFEYECEDGSTIQRAKYLDNAVVWIEPEVECNVGEVICDRPVGANCDLIVDKPGPDDSQLSTQCVTGYCVDIFGTGGVCGKAPSSGMAAQECIEKQRIIKRIPNLLLFLAGIVALVIIISLAMGLFGKKNKKRRR